MAGPFLRRRGRASPDRTPARDASGRDSSPPSRRARSRCRDPRCVWVRCSSAVLIRISTLPPITPARSRTDFSSVTSSGTRSICGSVGASGALLPRLGDAEPHDVGAGLHQRLGQRLPDRALAVGDQHLAEFRIAGHLAQHRIVRHVHCVLRRKRDQHRLPAFVEMRAHRDARRRGAIAMQVRQQRLGPASSLHRAEPERHALAIVKLVRVMQHGIGDQVARAARSRAIPADATGNSRKPSAADTARWRNRNSAAARSALRRRPR